MVCVVVNDRAEGVGRVVEKGIHTIPRLCFACMGWRYGAGDNDRLSLKGGIAIAGTRHLEWSAQIRYCLAKLLSFIDERRVSIPLVVRFCSPIMDRWRFYGVLSFSHTFLFT